MTIHKMILMYRKPRRINARDVCSDISCRLLERRRRIEVEVFESVEVENPGNITQDILAQSFVEAERFKAGQSLCWYDKSLTCDGSARV